MIVRKAALTPVRYLGTTLKEFAWHTQRYFALMWRTIHATVTRPFYSGDLAVQLDSIGVGSIGIVGLLSASSPVGTRVLRTTPTSSATWGPCPTAAVGSLPDGNRYRHNAFGPAPGHW